MPPAAGGITGRPKNSKIKFLTLGIFMEDTQQEVIYVIGHKSPDTDSVASAIAYAAFKKALGQNAVPAVAGELNSETKFALEQFEMNSPEILKRASEKPLILVDHNEAGQAVEGFENSKLLEVIDHHKIGGLKTGNPIFFHNEPVGATGTIIASFYFQSGIEMTKEVAGILMAAILSDTVLFKSPTCAVKDRETVEKLSKICQKDPMEFGMEMLKAKSDIESKSARDIIKGDYKLFDFSGVKGGVSQIEVMDLSCLESRREEILLEMEAVRKEEGLGFVLIMLTDVMKEASDLLFVGGHSDKFEEAFGAKMENGSIYKEGILSRKKQVIPPLEAAFSK